MKLDDETDSKKADVLLIIWTIVFWLGVLYLAACIVGCANPDAVQGIQGKPGAPADPVAVITQPAAPGACFAGGTTITIGLQDITVCNGITGSIGPSGNDGAPGTPGAPGEQGPPGTPGTSISIVQFCSGATSYPSSFVEIGFCINNSVYAVYSEHDGFLTYVPPGNYSSNAHNSSCNFTVQPNCTISH